MENKVNGPVVLGHPLPVSCNNKQGCFYTGQCKKTEEQIKQEKDFKDNYDYKKDTWKR